MLIHTYPTEGFQSLADYFSRRDADRFRYLADVLRDADRPHLAAMAEAWADEVATRQQEAV